MNLYLAPEPDLHAEGVMMEDLLFPAGYVTHMAAHDTAVSDPSSHFKMPLKAFHAVSEPVH